MTYQTPQDKAPYTRLLQAGSAWSRMAPGRRAAIILAAMFLPCCGGLGVIGAIAGEPAGAPTVVDGAPAPAPDRADVEAQAPGPGATSEPAPPPTTAAVTTPGRLTAPVVEKRTVTETRRIPFGTRRVDDPSLTKGTTRVRTGGVAGLRTLTYEVTLTDGVQTGRRLVRSVVTRKPVTRVVAVGTRAERGCHPNYGGCVPVASDVDCAGGTGNGPAYVSGPVRVIGADVYDLDRDGDGYGCDD